MLIVSRVMGIQWNTHVLLIVFAVVTCFPTKANSADLPTLTRGGKVENSACTERNMRELKKSLLSRKIKAQSQVWKAIRVMLCDDITRKNAKLVTEMLASNIQSIVEGTGQDTHRESIPESSVPLADLFARGKAFDAMIENSSQGIELSYSPNEACVESRKFKYFGNRWQLVFIGQACD